MTDVRIEEVSWEAASAQLLQIRHAVFVEEQRVPVELEQDEYDPLSLHLLARDANGLPVGTARILPSGRIGRVAVLSDLRRSGIGTALMNRLLEIAERRSLREVYLHAQHHSIPFYESFGFIAKGPTFYEAGIPHREMRLTFQ